MNWRLPNLDLVNLFVMLIEKTGARASTPYDDDDIDDQASTKNHQQQQQQRPPNTNPYEYWRAVRTLARSLFTQVSEWSASHAIRSFDFCILLRSFNEVLKFCKKMVNIFAIYFHNLKPFFQNYKKTAKILKK